MDAYLNVESLPHDGRVEFPFEGQQVHVSLRLRHQVPHFLREDLIGQLLLLLAAVAGSSRSRVSEIPVCPAGVQGSEGGKEVFRQVSVLVG